MRRLFDYIEALKRETCLDSNAKIADYLGVTRQYITKLKYDKTWISAENALSIAKALGIQPAEIVLVMYAQKSVETSNKDLWYQQADLVRSEINPPIEFKPFKSRDI